MAFQKQNRTPKFKDCKHDWRLLANHRGYWIFYCTKCLLFGLKDLDKPFDDWIDGEIK